MLPLFPRYTGDDLPVLFKISIPISPQRELLQHVVYCTTVRGEPELNLPGTPPPECLTVRATCSAQVLRPLEPPFTSHRSDCRIKPTLLLRHGWTCNKTSNGTFPSAQRDSDRQVRRQGAAGCRSCSVQPDQNSTPSRCSNRAICSTTWVVCFGICPISVFI